MFKRSIMSTNQVLDTIIIGAGWSGAVAARELVRKGRKVLVLEARDRVGGRANTWVKGDVKVDVGCSWIHGYKEGNPAGYIAQDFGVVAHLPKAAEGVVYGPNGRLSSSEADSLRASLGAAHASTKLPHPTPPPDASLASALFADNSSLVASNQKDLAVALARSLEIPLGLKLEKASLRWAGWEAATAFAGSDAAPEGGYEALVNKVIEDAKAKGAEVKLSTKIAGVSHSENGLVVTDAQGNKFTAKTAVSTIPLGTLKTLPESTFNPPLPPRLQEVIKGTHVGVLEKLLLQYPTAWWPDADKAGSYTFLPTSTKPVVITESSTPAEIFEASTLVCANFASSTLPGPSPTLLTYLSETPATALLRFDSEEVAAAYHKFLVSRFEPSSEPPAPVETGLTNWLTDEFSCGATTTPSIISSNGERSPLDFKELSRPVWDGRLGFAGEHTEMENRGSVAGAVISGYREAERVERLLKFIEEDVKL
ncbi:flavin containing amine oxidoreductase [Colletotrichum graminicola]|uniref:Flavin containing amine oxidoreductase n=1 Tax=Colletotrichum graminicola (strain M1.001 / M2 / FGSC 10212) TaxID=645133 RepID=E3QZ27_COLGM|nr:flavin containing amine oxidoreductase [Colletotrichum graminicola M1.001]EFQ36115.1 flavin containing amine oxidoreductase [Colletotrichum graminicola M1.001]WDK14877.1 flavin containing amine oxidoreductase [Colletotrichum graminicola]